jgi:hypothetical protein
MFTVLPKAAVVSASSSSTGASTGCSFSTVPRRPSALSPFHRSERNSPQVSAAARPRRHGTRTPFPVRPPNTHSPLCCRPRTSPPQCFASCLDSLSRTGLRRTMVEAGYSVAKAAAKGCSIPSLSKWLRFPSGRAVRMENISTQLSLHVTRCSLPATTLSGRAHQLVGRRHPQQ